MFAFGQIPSDDAAATATIASFRSRTPDTPVQARCTTPPTPTPTMPHPYEACQQAYVYNPAVLAMSTTWDDPEADDAAWAEMSSSLNAEPSEIDAMEAAMITDTHSPLFEVVREDEEEETPEEHMYLSRLRASDAIDELLRRVHQDIEVHVTRTTSIDEDDNWLDTDPAIHAMPSPTQEPNVHWADNIS